MKIESLSACWYDTYLHKQANGKIESNDIGMKAIHWIVFKKTLFLTLLLAVSSWNWINILISNIIIILQNWKQRFVYISIIFVSKYNSFGRNIFTCEYFECHQQTSMWIIWMNIQPQIQQFSSAGIKATWRLHSNFFQQQIIFRSF